MNFAQLHEIQSEEAGLSAVEIERVFQICFSEHYNIRIIGGAEEPLYLPVDCEESRNHNISYNRLYYSHDYAASALHEIAHWCIASQKRLQQVDWGYWYLPDGRNAKQQAAFEKVEARNQALEWIFNQAAGRHFGVSIDNLNGEGCETVAFKDAVYQQLQSWLQRGLPSRAQLFVSALEQGSGVLNAALHANYSRQQLDD